MLGLVAAVAIAGCGNDGSSNAGADVRDYSVEFSIQSASRLGALQLEITHLGSSGSFIGRGDKLDCVALVDAILAASYVGENVAKIGLISLHGVVTPSAIMRCGFRTREELGAADFSVEVTDASDTESLPVDPVPTAVVSTVTER